MQKIFSFSFILYIKFYLYIKIDVLTHLFFRHYHILKFIIINVTISKIFRIIFSNYRFNFKFVFFFYLFIFIKLIKFLGFIFNYYYLLNANYFSLVPNLLNNCINKNIPEVVIKYKNAEKYRAKILKENKSKSEVYLITNEINKDIYVGSSYDLAKILGKHTFIKYFNNYR